MAHAVDRVLEGAVPYLGRGAARRMREGRGGVGVRKLHHPVERSEVLAKGPCFSGFFEKGEGGTIWCPPPTRKQCLLPMF